MKLPRLIGNRAAWAVLLFIAILILLSWRCSAQAATEIDVKAGASVVTGSVAPVLGLDVRFPQGNGVTLFAGTTLWGETHTTQPNWSWQTGFEACRWSVCASLGAAYVQRVDAITGSHADFFLALKYDVNWSRVRAVGWEHLSNAGTTNVNVGRNAALVVIRAQ